MSNVTRSLTVFGLTAAWTLGFTAWARFLSRREVTRGAAGTLELIAAAIAPLAPVALAPVALSNVLLFAPLLLGWAGFTFALARKLSAQRDAAGGPWVAALMAMTTLMMGAAPLGASMWLMAAPLTALWLSTRSGRRLTPAQTAFAALAPLYLLTLFAVRLGVELGPNLQLFTWAPFASAAIAALLRLHAPRTRVDALSVFAVALQVAALGASSLGEPPAFFLSSLLLWVSGRTLIKRDARWLYPSYAGAYFAFQSCGQLVPSQLRVVLAALREKLGYPASHPLPPAYDAVYAAVFVVAGGLLAWRWFRRQRPEGFVLLHCTAVASALVGVVGFTSIQADVRPALWSAPAVCLLCLVLGLALSRRYLTYVGAALTLVVAAAVGGALPISALALALAVISLFALKGHREALSLASGTHALIATALAFNGAHQPLAVALASAAALLVAYNLGSSIAIALAYGLCALVLPNVFGAVGLTVLLPCSRSSPVSTSARRLRHGASRFSLRGRTRWSSSRLASRSESHSQSAARRCCSAGARAPPTSSRTSSWLWRLRWLSARSGSRRRHSRSHSSRVSTRTQ